MPSWYQLLIGEGRMSQEEEEYQTFKRIMKGERVPPSAARQEFLKNYRPWVFQIEIEEPALPKGRALLAAKEVFFDPEEGAPKFFEPQRTLRITKWDAERTEEGWLVTLWFNAQFKKKAGKRIEPTEAELEELGFSSDEPEIEPEEIEEEEPEMEEPQTFKIIIKVPKQGITQKQAVYLAGKQLPKKVAFIKQGKVLGQRTWEEPGKYVVEVMIEGIPTTDELPEGVYPQE